jgi:hypothetical protein
MFSARTRRPRVAFVGLLASVLMTVACSSSKQAPTDNRAPQVPSPTKPGGTALWGDLKPVVSVKELMRDMLDPASDFIFDAVKIEFTKRGTIERSPKTDADWDKIRFGAVTIAEGVYLLKIPRPFAPPGDENNSSGPNATELSPAQITAKLEADPVLWNAKIEALRNVGLEVMEIVRNKKVDELWDAGDNLDRACETCHIQYWYPGDKALLERVDKGIQQRYEESLKNSGRSGRKN